MIPRSAYFHINQVKIVGYRGVSNQFEVIKHFVDKAAALENVIVDTRCFKVFSHLPWNCISRDNIQDEIYARDYAKEQQLKKYIPSRINVKIL